ncbi:uncharacterized protein LOC141561388 [Sminthopsis crassicaudata]|uniref:uncharacterized protein LOC141561388 n=1 Tax=Sminthopsis crassicaudata TaxID=9301 RepID=UPI003D6970A7
MGRKQRLFPKVEAQFPAKDLHPKVQSSLSCSQHRILSSREEDQWSRDEQTLYFNQAKTKSLPLSDRRITPVPTQYQKNKETTGHLPDSDNEKVAVLLPYLDKWKMTKPPSPHKHHYMATVLPSIYHEYKTKGIPMSLPSLEQCVTPLLRPDQKVQILLQPDSWGENSLTSDQNPKVSHYQFNQYSTTPPISDHWFEVPLYPSSQDGAMVESLACHNQQTSAFLSGKPWIRETPHLNHWHRAIVTSLPCLDHWYRATAMTASNLSPWMKTSGFTPSHSHLYPRSRAVPSLQTNLYTKVTIPCSFCPYQWIKRTSTLSSHGRVMVIPSSNPQLQARTKALPLLGPEFPAKGTAYSPCSDYCGEVASMLPPYADNMTVIPRKSDKSKDIFGSLLSSDPHDVYLSDANHCDDVGVSADLNHEISS